VPDLVDRIRRELADRLAELEPVVREYRQLERVRAAMGEGEPRGRRGRSRSGRQTSARRAARGERQRQILSLLEEHPEISSSELARRLETSTSNIQTTLSRLRRRGRLDREGGRWIVAAEGEQPEVAGAAGAPPRVTTDAERIPAPENRTS
jgi:predicted HTH transcriptional regulator